MSKTKINTGLEEEIYWAMVELKDQGIECPKLEAVLLKITEFISRVPNN